MSVVMVWLSASIVVTFDMPKAISERSSMRSLAMRRELPVMWHNIEPPGAMCIGAVSSVTVSFKIVSSMSFSLLISRNKAPV